MTVERRYKLLHAITGIGDIDLTMSPTWTGNWTLAPTSGLPLTIVKTGEYQREVLAAPGDFQAYQAWFTSALVRRAYFGFGNSGNDNLQLTNETAAGTIELRTNGVAALSVSPAALLSGRGPVAAGLVDLTPDTGTYTGTVTGITTVVTGTITWARVGNLVILSIPGSMSGLSNSTSCTITGAMPASIQPARVQVCAVPASQFNSAGAASTTTQALVTGSSSVITFRQNGNATGFTNDGLSKGVVSTFNIYYTLN